GRLFTQPLTVFKDPYSEGTEADIQVQVTTLFELGRDMDRAADIVNGIEIARSQIERLTRVVEDQDVRKAADDLNQKMIAVEQNLVDQRLNGPAGHTWESRLARKLYSLARQLRAA